MTNDQINKRFAELVGIPRGIAHYPYEYPDFISDPRLVLREMVKRSDWEDFQKQVIDPFAYILDTTGKLVTLAIKYLDK